MCFLYRLNLQKFNQSSDFRPAFGFAYFLAEDVIGRQNRMVRSPKCPFLKPASNSFGMSNFSFSALVILFLRKVSIMSERLFPDEFASPFAFL